MAGNAAAVASCAAGYVIGSVPFGLIVGRAVGGLDVRDFGSGNMGTANVLRTLGARAGAIIGALALSRTMSVGSLTAAGTATLGAGLAASRRHDAVPLVFTALASTLVIVRHAPYIRRIARGEEPQLSSRLWGSRH